MMCYIAFIKDCNLQVLLPDPIPQPPHHQLHLVGVLFFNAFFAKSEDNAI